MRMRKPYLALGLLVAALGLVATVTFAASEIENKVLDQWKTAVQHSKFTQDYSAMKEVQSHLQHVVNCIEGPKGLEYDGGVGNPCQGKGTGMMNDAKAAGSKYAQAAPKMELANDVAISGLKAKTVEKAKAAGWASQLILEQVGASLK